MNSLFPDMQRSSARISNCGQYRYWLHRSWPSGDGRVICFVMLNPSTADHQQDDPTIRRCVGFAKAWGFSHLFVRNLFCLRATDPKQLLKVSDPVGPEADAELVISMAADMVLVAWGGWVPLGREKRALELLATKDVYCLGKTASGQPRHPLYCKGDLQPVLFREGIR